MTGIDLSIHFGAACVVSAGVVVARTCHEG